MKKALIPIVALMIILPLSAAGRTQVQKDPNGECYNHAYLAGSNLGRASALLNYNSDRSRLEAADEVLFNNLRTAGEQIEATFKKCAKDNPAWDDFASKQEYLANLINSIRKQPDSTNRYEVARKIGLTYHWGQALRFCIVGEQAVERDTPSEKFFKLGFQLGYAQQTLAIAEERLQQGRADWTETGVEGRAYLQSALRVLDEYSKIAGSPNLSELKLVERINIVIRTESKKVSTINSDMRAICNSLQEKLSSL